MDTDTTIQVYVDAWNERDPDRVAAMLADVFSESGSYTDPGASVSGRDAVTAHIVGFHERFPTATMERRSRIDGYGNVVRFGWALVDDGVDLIVGTDFVVLDDDGTIRSVTGFFGVLE